MTLGLQTGTCHTRRMKNPHPVNRNTYHWRRFLVLTVIGLMAGTLLIFLKKDRLPVSLANRMLAPYGIEVITISGARFSWDSIHADIIELRILQSPDTQRVEQFQLEFEPLDLLNGQIKSLSVQQAGVLIPVSGSLEGIQARMTEISLLCDPMQQCLGSARLDIDIDALQSPETGLSISASKTGIAINFHYQAPELLISLPEGQQFTLDSLSYGDQHIEQLELITGQHSQLQLNLSNQTMSLNVVESNLTFKMRGVGDSNFDISNINLSCSALSDCDANANLDAQLSTYEFAEPGVSLAGASVGSNIQLQYRASEITITLPAGSLFTLASANYAQNRVEQVEAVANERLQISVDLSSRQASLLADNVTIRLPVIRMLTDTENTSLSGLTAHLQQLDAHLEFAGPSDRSLLQQLTASAGLQISQVYTTLAPYNLWPYQWDSQIEWSEADQLHIQLDVLHPDHPLMSIVAEHSTASNSGNATFTMGELNWSPAGSRLSSYVAPLPFEADLLDGTINLDGKLSWQIDHSTLAWATTGQMRLQLADLAGFADEIVFAGLTATSIWDLHEDLSVTTQAPFLLNIRELNPGIPLLNVQSTVSVDTGSHLIHLESPQVEVFGGAASTDSIHITLPEENSAATPSEVFIVEINGIDLAQVLSLSAYQQVGATGIISGTLPVRLQGLTPLIEGGLLTASQQGGSIRYDQGSATTGNQSLDLVYQALEYYQYDTLSAGVDFDELGELVLSLQMQGQSPNVEQGQRINLNLNISDNIPALLQSLQAADNITERFQDLIEQR